jgi:hypothetical protein
MCAPPFRDLEILDPLSSAGTAEDEAVYGADVNLRQKLDLVTGTYSRTGDMQPAGVRRWVLIGIDGTTRFVAPIIHGCLHVVGSGNIDSPKTWHTWFVLRGSESMGCVRRAQSVGQWDAQVLDIQQNGVPEPGGNVRSTVFLVQDGSAASTVTGGTSAHNATDENAKPCWLCAASPAEMQTALHPGAHAVMDEPHPAALFQSVKPICRPPEVIHGLRAQVLEICRGSVREMVAAGMSRTAARTVVAGVLRDCRASCGTASVAVMNAESTSLSLEVGAAKVCTLTDNARKRSCAPPRYGCGPDGAKG